MRQKVASLKTEKQKQGFTMVEVSLFLALSGLILMGILVSVTGSITRQRFYDSSQGVAEFFRQTYSEVLNPKNEDFLQGFSCAADGVSSGGSRKGSSSCAIYGRLITFETTTLAHTYYVVGAADIKEFTKDTNLYLVSGTESSFIPTWGATMEGLEKGDKYPLSILITRDASGNVHTYQLPGNINSSTSTAALPTKDAIIWDIDVCVGSPDASNDQRYDIRIAADGANTSAVQIVSLDSDDNRCGKNSNFSYDNLNDGDSYYVFRDSDSKLSDGKTSGDKGWILTLDANPGTFVGTQGAGTFTKSCRQGKDGQCTITDGLPSAIRDGYRLKSWSTKDGKATYSPTSDAQITLASSTTLYADWEKYSQPTLSFINHLGAILDPLSCEIIGEAATSCTIDNLPSLTSSNGYKFRGWSTNSSSNTPTYAAGDSITITRPTVLYAVVTPEVYFDCNGGTLKSGTAQPQELARGTRLTNKTDICEAPNGFKFIGWSSEKYETGDTKTYTPSNREVTVDTPATVYAVWAFDGVYRFHSELDSNYVLDVAGQEISDNYGTVIVYKAWPLNDKENARAQEFRVKYETSDDYYRISWEKNDKEYVFDAANGSGSIAKNETTTLLVYGNFHSGANQRWIIDRDANGSYYIALAGNNTNFVVDIDSCIIDRNSSGRTSIHVYPNRNIWCGNGAHQRWLLEYVGK